MIIRRSLLIYACFQCVVVERLIFGAPFITNI